MGNQLKDIFCIKGEYDGELCLLADVQGVGPWKFTAEKIVEGDKESCRVDIDPEKIRFPSLSAMSGYENLQKLMFFHLFNALSTSRFDGGVSRLNTGFGVINGELDGLVNSPEEYGEEPLIASLFARVSSAEVDWSTYFYFGTLDANNKQGISIDILHPDQCNLFFIPIIFEKLDDGGLYFSLDVTKTELVAQGKGVGVVGRIDERQSKNESVGPKPSARESSQGGGLVMASVIILTILVVGYFVSY